MRKILKSTLKKEKGGLPFQKTLYFCFYFDFGAFTPIFATFHIVFTQISRRCTSLLRRFYYVVF